MAAKSKRTTHRWQFKARFRRHAFGWRSQPAITRIKEAVSEIRKVARMDKMLAAEGAVCFLEKVPAALEHMDSSSGAIGTAVNNAIDALVDVITSAPADDKTREKWLERLWDAYQDDEIPYIEVLGDYWGQLCVTQDIASRWADQLLGTCKMAWSPDPNLRGFFKGTTSCLSALLAAERHEELLELLEMAPYQMWHYRQYGVKAIAALGKKAEAIRYAEDGRRVRVRDHRTRRAQCLLVHDEGGRERRGGPANTGTYPRARGCKELRGAVRDEGSRTATGVVAMRRGHRSPFKPEGSVVDAALDAMGADALRELVRGLLPWLDDKTHAKVTGEIIDRAARSKSDWTPDGPTDESVAEVLEFAEAAQRVGYADPSEVDDYLRRGMNAFLAKESPSVDDILMLAGIATVDDASARAAMLKAMQKAAEKRLDGVTENKRRRYYGHAASLAAACAAVDGSGASVKRLAAIRDEYRRYPALQREFDQLGSRR